MTMRKLFTGIAAIAASLTVGCATMAVSSFVRPGLDIAHYRTYDWGPADSLPAGDARLEGNPFFQDHVQGAIEKELAMRGIERAESAPDMLIHLHASITQRIDVNQADRQFGYCETDDCPGVSQFEAGTLVLDFIDARTNRLIWRGWAQDSVEQTLENNDRLQRQIEEAVRRMMARFPQPL
jgi:hypothetical protein